MVIILIVDSRPRAELEKLMLSLFSEAEVRKVVRLLPDGDRMHAELPGAIASPSVLVHEAVSVLERHGRIDEHFVALLLEERPARADAIRALAARMPGLAGLGPPDEWLLALPEPLHDRLMGRQQELARLDAAWREPGTRVLSIVAWGGAGKSTLVHHWLGRMRQAGWRGARKIYGWSFYAQGTHDTNASSEAFFAAALEFFGDPAAVASPPQARARRLVQLIQQQPTLLVLDGLEPLQKPPHGLDPGGKLRDPNLGAFLRALAQGLNGLCLVTSRLAVKDLASQRQGAAPVLMLERLSTADGAALLRDLGVRGSEPELRMAADELEGHALALMLLGKYLHEVHDGDIGRRHDVLMRAAAEDVDGGKARRVMAAYDTWLDARARAVMRLVGLFDRPADDAALAALRRAPAIPGLTEPLVDAGEDTWRIVLGVLRRVGLLAPESPQHPGALDAHPLVRAYFGETLRREQPEASRAAHARLYEHYLAGAAGRPASLDALGRLFDAVIHGCHAGRHAEVYRNVYLGLVHHDGRDQVTRLGAYGLELRALATFFERRWDRPVAALDPDAQAHVLQTAGFDLRVIGQLDESLNPSKVALDLDRAAGRWGKAAIDAMGLAELELLVGHIDEAQRHAEEAMALADRSGDASARVRARAARAEVLHCAGQLDASERMFREADRLQAARNRDERQLYGPQNARYCALLLDLAAPLDGSTWRMEAQGGGSLAEARQRCLVVRQRAESAFGLAQSKEMAPLRRGLDQMNLGRAHLGLWLAARGRGTPAGSPDVVAHRDQAVILLDLAVDELRQSGRDDMLPRALLARAGLRRFLDDRDGAALDLAEVVELAERSGMRLLACDAHLERARLALAGGEVAGARAHTGAARELITETGYHRRDRELAALDAALDGTFSGTH
jgi:tetratricopeptide (TPR) repeat protein